MGAAWALAIAMGAGPCDVSAQLMGSFLSAPISPNSPGNFAAEIATPPWATADHPLFHSSYTGDENRVVAQTRYGPVTSSDLYLWLTMRDGASPFLLESYGKARTQEQREELGKTLRKEIEEFVFTNYVIPEIMGNAPCDAVAALRERLRMLPAYQLVYILRVIKPQICIQEADRVKHLQQNLGRFDLPERWRVRYIRLLATFNEPIEEQDRTEARMVDLRQQIAQGDVTFADAARKHSQAPSASRGGEIPPIRKGELFFFFDEAVEQLEPGEVSQPFRGPDGSYYLVQLLENVPAQKPTLQDPAVARRVDESLWLKVLRAEYEYTNRRLFERKPTMMFVTDWDDRSDDDLVAGVGDFGMAKCQVRDVFPWFEDENIARRDDLFGKYLTPILEREAMAQEVREGGCDQDPLLVRARWMAANLTRHDALSESCEAGLEMGENIVRAFWRNNPELFTPMTLKRIFKVTLAPTSVGPASESLVTELARVLTTTAAGEKATAIPPALVTSPGSVIDQVLSAGGEGALSLFGVPDAVETTGGEPLEIQPLEMDLDISPIESTGTLTVPETGAGPGTDAGGQDATGEAAAPASAKPRTPLPQVTAPQAVTPSQTTETLLLSGKSGGAAPASVGGGIAPGGFSDAPFASAVPGARREVAAAVGVPARSGVASSESVDVGQVPPDEAVPNPCCPPESNTDLIYGNSLGDFLPELPPVVPCPSAIPFNPDLRFPKVSAREVTELFNGYLSPDFAIQVLDMGYVYALDFKEIPKEVADFAPGTFSFPVAAGPAAVAYFVANAKSPAKPAFDEIKARVYMTYRSLKVNECLDATKKQALRKADIRYTF